MAEPNDKHGIGRATRGVNVEPQPAEILIAKQKASAESRQTFFPILTAPRFRPLYDAINRDAKVSDF